MSRLLLLEPSIPNVENVTLKVSRNKVKEATTDLRTTTKYKVKEATTELKITTPENDLV